MKKHFLNQLIVLLLIVTSSSFAQVNETQRSAANNLWNNYSYNPSNAGVLPNKIPYSTSPSNVDIRTLSTGNFSNFKSTILDLASKSGGIIKFTNTSAITILFTSPIYLKGDAGTSGKAKTILLLCNPNQMVTFNGNNAHRLFETAFGVNLIIQNATLKNGSADNGCGVKLNNRQNSVENKIRTYDVIMDSNKANGHTDIESGGAIRITNGCSGEIFKTEIKNSEAWSGGGIGGTSISRLTILDSKFTGNKAVGYDHNGYDAIEGAGALRVDRFEQQLNIYRTVFDNNGAWCKVSAIEIFTKPIPSTNAYPSTTHQLIVDGCTFKNNKYIGTATYSSDPFFGSFSFHGDSWPNGTTGTINNASFILRDTDFYNNEIVSSDVRLETNYDISNCIFAANTLANKSIPATEKGKGYSYFLKIQTNPDNKGAINRCTFYNTSSGIPKFTGKDWCASDIQTFNSANSKMTLNNCIFYRTSTDATYKQVSTPITGSGNCQFFTGITSSFPKVSSGNSNITNPNITRNSWYNMCMNTNSLPLNAGGLPECGTARMSSDNNLIKSDILNTAIVYPNPTTSKIQVSLNKDWKEFKYKVIDISGRLLIENKSFIKEFEIDLSTQNNGIYYIILEKDNEQSEIIKILKQ